MTIDQAKYIYCLRIADNANILSHRLSEWSGHGPILEEDIAMSNMALDLIGQARGFYTYAGVVEGKNRSEDELAYLRDERDYYNRLIVEQPDAGDFGVAMMRSFLYCTFSYLQLRALINSSDETISGLSSKSIKEITYHVRHTSEWIIRLGDGTDFSHQKIQEATEELWSYTDELFEQDEVDAFLVNEKVAVDLSTLRNEWDKMVDEIFSKAKIQRPSSDGFQAKGGIKGLHSESLGFILAEMQFLPRAYPQAKW
jgi:ring-1,2-phenylacetyl-CoA epoxidase subunit PaaC